MLSRVTAKNVGDFFWDTVVRVSPRRSLSAVVYEQLNRSSLISETSLMQTNYGAVRLSWRPAANKHRRLTETSAYTHWHSVVRRDGIRRVQIPILVLLIRSRQTHRWVGQGWSHRCGWSESRIQVVSLTLLREVAARSATNAFFLSACDITSKSPWAAAAEPLIKRRRRLRGGAQVTRVARPVFFSL